MPEHTTLDWIALGLLFFATSMTVLVFLWAHEIPYKLAKKRGHPHLDAVRAACWLSLFTGGLIWPLALLWSLSSRPRVYVRVLKDDQSDTELWPTQPAHQAVDEGLEDEDES